jgi:uncharacterized protein (TIGR03435 family)
LADQQTAPAPLSFDVASVKVLENFPYDFRLQRVGDRIHWTNSIMGMIMWAYQREAYEISFPPAALPKESTVSWYGIDAKTPAETTEEQLHEMVRTLLADRFKFGAHHETRELQGYSLVLGKNGLKIAAAKPDDKPAAMPEWFKSKDSPAFAAHLEGTIMGTMEGRGITALTARRVSMEQVAKELSRQLRTFVIDKTGVPGQFYFGIRYAQVDSDGEADAPTVFEALQSELGMRLEKQKGPVDVLVVDHVQRIPTQN